MDIETYENYFKNFYAKNGKVNEHIVLAGDFNLNVLDFENCIKIQNLMNLMVRYGMIPIINKPTQVTAKAATAIDHIKTNATIDLVLRTQS